MQERWVQPVTLDGQAARLEPLELSHLGDLLAAAAAKEIWTYMPVNMADRNALKGWIETALAERAAGSTLAFAILDPRSGKAIGSTRYMDIRPRDRGLEIGWTWLDPAYWRSPVNTEAKFLLLQHAFESLGAIRVQLKTHRLNFRSRRAIERIGAQFEGILRNHTIMPDGSYRDSAYYSFIDSEWPAVKRHLAQMMAPGASPG
jgi:RimJ/RimL family protein N-acetyltransferase